VISQVSVRGADDGLGVVGLAVDHEQVGAGRSEAILLEKPVAAEPVVLGHGHQDLPLRKIPSAMCQW
jgi:hypothetical protein